MQKHFGRLVGIAVILIVVMAALLLWWVLSLGNATPQMWKPIEVTLGGLWTTFYSAQSPDLSILISAVLIAVVLVLFVVVGERLVTLRYRRSSVEKSTNRPLSPRTVMARTRGVYAGEVTTTVLIPAHNEEQSLPHTINALKDQSFPPARVLVVADNCTDGTVEVARRHGVDVFESVDNLHKKGGALNQALAQVLPSMGDNDCVMVMDADSQIGADFLAVARDRFTADRALMAVGGLFHGEPGHGLIGQFQRNEYTRYQREIARRDGRVFVLTGTASVFRASALRAVASARGNTLPGTAGEVYDTAALTEDNELTIALKSLGALTTSPEQCTVVTELMPNWKMLWAQRLRWQRGALENLGAYGVTPQTMRYWAQQIGIGYGLIALFSYFFLMVLMMVSMDTWVWFPFWLLIGLIFAVERVVTVWEGGWKARIVAALVLPELIYDAFLDLAFLKGVSDIAFARSADWKHVEHQPSNEAV
ncbi:glycosyltransferase family 2 protein [Glutamicibacter sp.]|uniref:glycosyltransferase family 2 protein n=1 Tax=Glutamicibacter sp. TaxID=1931995 RepID=UPI0028BE9F6E|nr:glycosyltransferase family 2 protein [Glutamicibacter sp.]